MITEEIIKAILEKYCDLQNGEKIVVDEGPEGELLFSVWSESASQDEVEEFKMKIAPQNLSSEDRAKLIEMNLFYDPEPQTWIY